MQREFGKRTFVRPPRQATAQSATTQPTFELPEPVAGNPAHMRQAITAIVLTVAVVGGMFLLPRMGQCQGGKGALGLDWCRLMKASVEGAVRGLAIGRGTIAAGGH
jgi:hypothetical protein